MSTNERQYDETDKKILTATISLLSNILFNDFALENIVLKKFPQVLIFHITYI